MTKPFVLALILVVCLLTSCSLLDSDYVVINNSDVDLEVEYEFFVVNPNIPINTFPAKQELAKYELENAEHKNDWRLLETNEYESENNLRERVLPHSQDKRSELTKTIKIKLKLRRGEVLKVDSVGLSSDSLIYRLSLKGERGSIVYENGRLLERVNPLLERFNAHYQKTWFPQSNPFDYRIVYK